MQPEILSSGVDAGLPVVAFVHRTDLGAGVHLGLLFHGAEPTAPRTLAHQPWHQASMFDDSWPEGLWVRPRAPDDALVAVALLLRRLRATKTGARLPFGFERGMSRITRKGNWEISGGLGLNCSTFVMGVFEHVRFPLVQASTWETRGGARKAQDDGVQTELVDQLRPKHRDHADRLSAEVGATRFRPEEIAAATGLSPHPVPFAQAEAAGPLVVKRLSS